MISSHPLIGWIQQSVRNSYSSPGHGKLYVLKGREVPWDVEKPCLLWDPNACCNGEVQLLDLTANMARMASCQCSKYDIPRYSKRFCLPRQQCIWPTKSWETKKKQLNVAVGSNETNPPTPVSILFTGNLPTSLLGRQIDKSVVPVCTPMRLLSMRRLVTMNASCLWLMITASRQIQLQLIKAVFVAVFQRIPKNALLVVVSLPIWHMIFPYIFSSITNNTKNWYRQTSNNCRNAHLLLAACTWHMISSEWEKLPKFRVSEIQNGVPLAPLFTYLMAAIFFSFFLPLPARRSIHGTFWPPVQKGSLRSVSLMNPANSLVKLLYLYPVKQFPVMRLWFCTSVPGWQCHRLPFELWRT